MMQSKWSPWWVAMWIAIVISLLWAAFFMDFWHWWTLVIFAFGIPEFIGASVQNDSFPPLTHVIIRYVHPEIGMPLLFFFTGAVGAFWIGFKHPMRLGLLVGFVGWLTAHFLPRWLERYHS